MKTIIFLLLVFCSVQAAMTQTPFYTVDYGNGNGFRLWGSDEFKIHMGNSSEYNYGPVSGFSIKMNMRSYDGPWGWTWGTTGQTPVAALNAQGHMQIAGDFSAGNVSLGSPASVRKVYSSLSSLGAIELPRGGLLYSNTHTSDLLYLCSNAYFNGDFYLRNSAPAGLIGIDGGNIYLQTAPTGTAGTVGAFSSKLTITNSGNVGIGTNSPNQKLTVNGTIYGKEVKVDLSVPGPDYVFEESYNLPSLEKVESYIDQNKHLPEVPSATEMEKNGINVSEMNMLLLKKVEELTLYVIELKKENEKQQKQIDSITNK